MKEIHSRYRIGNDCVKERKYKYIDVGERQTDGERNVDGGQM